MAGIIHGRLFFSDHGAIKFEICNYNFKVNKTSKHLLTATTTLLLGIKRVKEHYYKVLGIPKVVTVLNL